MSLSGFIPALPLCLIPAAVIVYFFLSKKSGPPVKRAALAALILLVLSLGVSAFFIVGGPAAAPVAVAGDIPVEPLEFAAADFSMIIAIALVVLFFIALIAYGAWRDSRKGSPPNRP
jgi:formate hydrogenlyase subunit 3/multisubunit Na+/H+ antiporter MnhD subunit